MRKGSRKCGADSGRWRDVWRGCRRGGLNEKEEGIGTFGKCLYFFTEMKKGITVNLVDDKRLLLT